MFESLFGKFNKSMLEFGLLRCNIDYSIFYKYASTMYMLVAYVLDGIVITCDDMNGIAQLKRLLSDDFNLRI